MARGVKHTFSCPVDGNPEPHIEWYNDKTGTKISSEKWLKTWESGCYTCVASNDVGPPVSVTQCLTISKFDFPLLYTTVMPLNLVCWFVFCFCFCFFSISPVNFAW